jgi:lysophospholipase L1-like esterase
MFLAFLEILARRVGAPDEQKNIEMDFNADMMWQLRDDPRKGEEYRVNALGLRGPELGAPDALRVLSLGDSSIYGHSVRIDEVFTSVVAARLNAARPVPAVEGVIGGIPGYSSYQSIRLLDRVGEAVAPDIVVIGNMWSDTFQSAITDADWAQELADAYGMWTPITAPLSLLSTHSALARNVRKALHDRFYPAKDTATEIGWVHLTKADPGLEDPTETTENLERRARGLPDLPPEGPRHPGGGGPNGGGGPGGPGGGPGGGGPNGGGGPGKGPPPPDVLKSENPGAPKVGGDAPPVGLKMATSRVPAADYGTNLRTLATRARELGALPVYLMLPHPNDGGAGLTPVEVGYRDTMRRVAAEEAVPLVDASDWFVRHPAASSRFADDIHPNAAGHADIATAVLEVLAADPATAARLAIPKGAFGP